MPPPNPGNDSSPETGTSQHMAEIKRNARQRMDGVRMLRILPDQCAALAIFDPQYRAILDEMDYGNEGARHSARVSLPQMDERDIVAFIGQIERVLRPGGHLALWCDKFIIGRAQHIAYLAEAGWQLKPVDLIHWNTMSIRMGYRTRGSSEYLVIAQKHPTRAAGVWTDRSFSDAQMHKRDRRHPHAKPVDLTARLIEAVTKPGDLVIDPAAGGYGTLEACQRTGREFVGCDLRR